MRSPSAPVISAHRASPSVILSLIAVSAVLAACTSLSAPTEAPTVSPAPSTGPASSAPASNGPSEGATSSAVPSASAVPSSQPTATATASAACITTVRAEVAPSDRLTGVAVHPGTDTDTITFTFGTSSGQPSGTHPTDELKPASPPFTLGGSGQTVTVTGKRFIAITFRGMAVADEQGTPTYSGPADIQRNAPAVRELRQIEAFEGVVTWIVGVDGPGCISLSRLSSPARIVVAVSH